MLLTFRRPLDVCSSSVDPENDESGLPLSILFHPYVSVPVCAARHNPVAVRCPIDSIYSLMMLQGNTLMIIYNRFHLQLDDATREHTNDNLQLDDGKHW